MARFGWSQHDFTPTRPAMLQGQKHVRVATEALDPLTVTAMVVDGGDIAFALVSCDLAFTTDSLKARVRRAVGEQIPALAGDRVGLLSTHTHTSLVIEDVYYDVPDVDNLMTSAECEALVGDAIIAAVVEAWESRSAGKAARAFGHAVVGHNRHAVYADGHAQMYGKTNRDDFVWFGGYEDHSLDMLFTWDATGTLSGVMLAVPCPSQVTESLHEISADYWHETRLELRKRLGDQLQVLGLCAAAGDQSPHFLILGEQEQTMRERRGVSERQEIALRIADAVERALACTEPSTIDDAGVRHTSRDVALTPRQVNQTERDWAAAEYDRCKERGDTTSWWPVRLKQVVDQFEGRWTPSPHAAELQAVRIGELALTTCPFELFVDYAMRIKARSTAPQTAVVQLSGMGYYLPSQRAVEGSGYGAMPAVSLVGPEGGAELVEHTLELIDSLFEANAPANV